METINELMETSQVSFGTSGARGLVSQMTDKICYSYTLGFIQHLLQSKQLEGAKQIAIAGDLRPSSPGIMRACAKAVLDSGFDVINCGFLASPGVALFGIENEIPAIMVTGSHIPDDRNGIKFNKPRGEILKNDEERIRQQQIIIPEGLFNKEGELIDKEYQLPEVDTSAAQTYLDRYLNFFPSNALNGLKVGVYQHSGVARDQIVELCRALGAEVVTLGRSETFVPVDTEAIRPEDVVFAKQWAEQHQLDAIFSTDGDADRPLISDEKGQWFRGDIAGILCAQYLGIKAIATPVSCNTALEKSQLFEKVVRTRIGSPYVISGMQELQEQGESSIAGYEANGGFLLAGEIERDGRSLNKLPTRDAIIVLLALLHQAKEQNISLSQLANGLPKRFTASDRLKNFAQEKSAEILKRYAQEQLGAQAIEQDFKRINSKVSHIDITDGVRIQFDNEEIVHFRPSGNAPEFRCYSEAESEQRAIELNQYCLATLKTLYL